MKRFITYWVYSVEHQLQKPHRLLPLLETHEECRAAKLVYEQALCVNPVDVWNERLHMVIIQQAVYVHHERMKQCECPHTWVKTSPLTKNRRIIMEKVNVLDIYSKK